MFYMFYMIMFMKIDSKVISAIRHFIQKYMFYMFYMIMFMKIDSKVISAIRHFPHYLLHLECYCDDMILYFHDLVCR